MTHEEAERAILEVWQKLLRRNDIVGETDFFEVGGDSLLGAMLMGSLGEMAGVEIDVMELYENPTLAQQAALLARMATVSAR